MNRTSTLVFALFLALALAAPGCKKIPVEKPPQEKSQPGKEKAPEPVSAADAGVAAEETDAGAKAVETSGPLVPPDPRAAKYVFLGQLGMFIGPPSPPIGEDESVSANELMEWTEVPFGEDRAGKPPKRFSTALEAALDVEALTNRGRLLFELLAQGDLDSVRGKFVISEFEYMQFLEQKGYVETSGKLELLKKWLDRQFEAQRHDYGKFAGPVKRTDRFDGMMEGGMVRMSRWQFEYTDKQGTRKQGCYLFLLSENSWRIMDLTCGDAPWDEAEKTESEEGGTRGEEGVEGDVKSATETKE